MSVACPSSIVPRPSAAEVEEVKPLIGKPVAFVNVPLDGVPSAPPEVSSVADEGIVVELIVSPSIFDTVAPEAIDVDPIVGAEYEDTVPQEAVEPSVVKYFPELPVCEGRLIGAAAHSTPFVAPELAVRIYPFVPTPSFAGVLSAEATIISPLASNKDSSTLPSN